MRTSLLLCLLFCAQFSVADTDKNHCPDWLNYTFRQLHSTNEINLCEQFGNKPLLLINTASHCGFTPQFSGLEKLHQQYKDKGLAVVGFASNDFKQAAKSEEKAATICYENFGVSFTMMAPIKVKGEDAHPLFKTLAEKSEAPSWNFNKFVVSKDGESVTHFGSMKSPKSKAIKKAIKSVL